MLSVLNFMYQGEVNITQDDLNSFLAVAEDLQVKGLTQNGHPSSSKAKQCDKPIPSEKVREKQEYHQTPPQPQSNTKHTRPVLTQESRIKYSHPPTSFSAQDEDIQEIVPVNVKSEPGLVQQNIEQGYVDNTINSGGGVVTDPNSEDPAYQDAYEDYDYDQAYHGETNTQEGTEGTKDIDDLVASYMQKITDENHVHMWQCIECGKTSRYITNLKDHVEANHLEGLTFRCPECQKASKSRQSLRAHMKTIHNLSSKHLKHYNHQE